MAEILDSITSVLSSVLTIPESTATSTGKTRTAEQTATSTDRQSQTRTTASDTKVSQSAVTATVTIPSPQSSTVANQAQAVISQEPTVPPTASTSVLLANTTVSQTKTTASSVTAKSTSINSITTIPETDASTSATITSSPSTTLATSTKSSSSATNLAQPVTSSATAKATATATAANTSADANKIPTAGIAVAAVLGFLVLATFCFLIFRYCAPVRRRYDAWQEKKRLERTYREAIDGVQLSSNKLGGDGSPVPASYAGARFYANDDIHTARVPQQGAGLGLGNRLSMLMQHSPFQTHNSHLRQSQIGMAVGDSGTRGQYHLPR